MKRKLKINLKKRFIDYLVFESICIGCMAINILVIHIINNKINELSIMFLKTKARIYDWFSAGYEVCICILVIATFCCLLVALRATEKEILFRAKIHALKKKKNKLES